MTNDVQQIRDIYGDAFVDHLMIEHAKLGTRLSIESWIMTTGSFNRRIFMLEGTEERQWAEVFGADGDDAVDEYVKAINQSLVRHKIRVYVKAKPGLPDTLIFRRLN